MASWNGTPQKPPLFHPSCEKLGKAEMEPRIDTGRQGRQPIRASARSAPLRSRWSLNFVKKLSIVTDNADRKYHSPALRAYVRVVTLKNARPKSETLAMLQRAMKEAENTADCKWILTRASTVRTVETVVWLAPYLDDPKLSQTACQSIVALAHHRFLRHPNMATFGPLLDKISTVSEDPKVVDLAKKYRLGL
jgi:hypothetical protein